MTVMRRYQHALLLGRYQAASRAFANMCDNERWLSLQLHVCGWHTEADTSSYNRVPEMSVYA